jgi:hypothetical protein
VRVALGLAAGRLGQLQPRLGARLVLRHRRVVEPRLGVRRGG